MGESIMMPFLHFDSTMLLLIPPMILALYAQWRVHHVYGKYQKVASAARLTGQDVARRLLLLNNLTQVAVEPHEGQLTDHYDPRARAVRLSVQNYATNSIAAISIAAHEVGHAIQHGTGYAPLRFRHALVPAANIGSSLALPLFFVGFFFGVKTPGLAWLMDAGILLFAGAVVFQLVTLPVEFDASRRALRQLQSSATLPAAETAMAREVLGAAALTYVAAAAVSAAHLLRLVLLRGAVGQRDD
jgi:Zn-dependent membrane protease YugP